MASMNDKEVCNQLSIYLGLDDASINEGILPYLKNIKSRAELQDYLTGLLGNDSMQSSFIAAYANTRFPVSASSSRPATHQPAQSSSHSQRSMNQASVPVKSKPTAAAAPPPQAARSLAPGFPSQSSNAKIQVIQPPAINVALPPTEQSRPSISVRTIEHVSGEAAAEVASRKIRQIEQRLRAAKGQSKEKACFCQAQEHPLSTVIPICPKCLLVLCDVNVPYSRACPSCTFRPLVSDAILAEQIIKLESERDSIIAKENERIRLESEEEERARRAIQFPELHDGRSISPAGGSSGSIDYARKAGAGPSHHQQVQQAYRNAQAREEAIAASGERRVLTLNSKTKKVQYQTIKPTKKSNAKAAEALNKQKKPAKQDDLEDDRQPYIDENDDGLLKAAHIAGERTKTDYSWPPKQGSGITYVKRKTAIDAADSTEDDSEVSDVSDAESGQENNELPEGSTAT